MKNSAPNEENQISTEQLENAQENSSSNVNVDDGSGEVLGLVIGGIAEVAVDLIGSIFED